MNWWRKQRGRGGGQGEEGGRSLNHCTETEVFPSVRKEKKRDVFFPPLSWKACDQKTKIHQIDQSVTHTRGGRLTDILQKDLNSRYVRCSASSIGSRWSNRRETFLFLMAVIFWLAFHDQSRSFLRHKDTEFLRVDVNGDLKQFCFNSVNRNKITWSR